MSGPSSNFSLWPAPFFSFEGMLSGEDETRVPWDPRIEKEYEAYTSKILGSIREVPSPEKIKLIADRSLAKKQTDK